jgi:hypothetical protein
MQRKGLLKGKTDKINGWGYFINKYLRFLNVTF